MIGRGHGRDPRGPPHAGLPVAADNCSPSCPYQAAKRQERGPAAPRARRRRCAVRPRRAVRVLTLPQARGVAVTARTARGPGRAGAGGGAANEEQARVGSRLFRGNEGGHGIIRG